MANRKTPTKRECYNALLNIPAVAGDPVLVAFINRELNLLDKKNSANRKPTAKEIAKREADADLRIAIVDEMEVGKMYSAGEMIKALPTLTAVPDLSAAKVSYLMRDLIKDGSVEKVVEKRHTFYRLAE